MTCFIEQLTVNTLTFRPVYKQAVGRAAKLSLWNFLSLFRVLQKPTRFTGGGGGVVAEFFPDLQKPTPFNGRGVSGRIFPCSPKADSIQWGGGLVTEIIHLRNHTFTPHRVIFLGRDTHHFWLDTAKIRISGLAGKKSLKFTKFREIL